MREAMRLPVAAAGARSIPLQDQMARRAIHLPRYTDFVRQVSRLSLACSELLRGPTNSHITGASGSRGPFVAVRRSTVPTVAPVR
jgi:hypothetical protein